MNTNTLKRHVVEDPVTYDLTLYLRIGVLGRPLDTLVVWALTSSWSRLAARVGSGCELHTKVKTIVLCEP